MKRIKVVEKAVEEYGYDLNRLPEECKCSLSKSYPDHDDAAKELIQFLIKDMQEVKTIVKLHPILIFNGVKSDDLIGLYVSNRNLGDVGVMIGSGDRETNLYLME